MAKIGIGACYKLILMPCWCMVRVELHSLTDSHKTRYAKYELIPKGNCILSNTFIELRTPECLRPLWSSNMLPADSTFGEYSAGPSSRGGNSVLPSENFAPPGVPSFDQAPAPLLLTGGARRQSKRGGAPGSSQSRSVISLLRTCGLN